MAVDLDDFLDSVLVQSAKALELTDAETEELVTTDPILLAAARLAYAQAASYTGRDFLRDTYKELYPDVEERFILKNVPVASVTSVTDDEGTALTVDVDYKVNGNHIIMDVDAAGYPQYISAGIDSDHHSVVVEYDGGYNSAEENALLEGALVFQTAANYNRRAHLGIALLTASSSGFKGGAIRIAPDKEKYSMVLEAQEILSPFVYYGTAESWT